MNEKTKRILNRIRTFLQEYDAKDQGLRRLVDNLEGSIRALDEELPMDFQSTWLYHWGNLEQFLAVGTEGMRAEEISEEIDALIDLLDRQLSDKG